MNELLIQNGIRSNANKSIFIPGDWIKWGQKGIFPNALNKFLFNTLQPRKQAYFIQPQQILLKFHFLI